MLTWIFDNLINITLIAVIALITGLLIRSMIRDKKAGKHSCGGNCASCGACGRYSASGRCGTIPKQANSVPGRTPR
ncbi:MAG: FeoB-associated Cys-rich membrane protein [Oscillospiraceae bacterium]|nr:FeoB-associated Cys-rich membrane protein [Oscillospiraceae bacterium]